MLLFLLRQFNLLVMTVFVLVLFSFCLAFLFPGDALTNLSGIHIQTDAQAAALADKYQTQAGYLQQYFTYFKLLLQGDWGLSFRSGLPLHLEILQALPASIELCIYAFSIALAAGIPLGLIAALKHHRLTDYSLLTMSVVGYSIPVFWLALILILVFSLQFGWLPLSGRTSLLYDIPYHTGFILIDILLSDLPDKHDALINALRHLMLPTLSIAVVTMTIVIRQTRRSMIDVLKSDYILAAKARGLKTYKVIYRHGLRNAVLPILPILATQTTVLLTNAMIVETIFSWPGIGHWLIQAIEQRDYPAIRAGMLAVSLLVVFMNVMMGVSIRLLNAARNRSESVTI